jgi:hypothetical protein
VPSGQVIRSMHDFWGYVRSLGDPHQVAAKVSSANPTDCGSQENSAAGLSRCYTLNHYKGDKVDWFFAHMNQVADAHIAGLLFGAGHGEQTWVETDGGNLINKTIACHNSGGVALK